jgi:hypothetical protein
MNLPKEMWFFIAVLYKDCSLQFAYRGFFRELTNMNLPKERWFFIAVLYKDCSLQIAYRGFFRELKNMNLPIERWCMENLLMPGHLQQPEPFFAHIFCKHIENKIKVSSYIIRKFRGIGCKVIYVLRPPHIW